MARKEVDPSVEVTNTDQGPYTGQSMEIPPSPFTPEEIEIIGYDDDGEPITVDRAAEREEALAAAEERRSAAANEG
jgi:hypothetical protein